MIRPEFREWLARAYPNANTQSTQLSQLARIELHYGDLDAAYDADGFEHVRKALTYTAKDEQEGRPNPSKLEINGALRPNLTGYRTSLGIYSRFRQEEAGGVQLIPAALAELKSRFLTHYPDFEELGFGPSRGAYWEEERAYKELVIARAQALLR